MRACDAGCIAQPTTFRDLDDVLKSKLFSTHAKLGVESQLAHLRLAMLGYYGPLTVKAEKRVAAQQDRGFDVNLLDMRALCGNDADGNDADGNDAAKQDWELCW